METQKRGAWQKVFVKKLTDDGVPHDSAMLAMALCADERQMAYMQGYDKGYEDGCKDEKVRGRVEGMNTHRSFTPTETEVFEPCANYGKCPKTKMCRKGDWTCYEESK